MIEFLNQLDTSLFLFLNSLHVDWLDPVMIFISGKFTWIPFYIVLLVLIIRQYRWQSLVILLFISVLISLSDQLSVRAFKLVFERPRPCHEPDLQALIHLAKGSCGGAFGFVSSHAANSFALAGFIWFILKPVFPKLGLYCFPGLRWLLIAGYIWACIIPAIFSLVPFWAYLFPMLYGRFMALLAVQEMYAKYILRLIKNVIDTEALRPMPHSEEALPWLIAISSMP